MQIEAAHLPAPLAMFPLLRSPV